MVEKAKKTADDIIRSFGKDPKQIEKKPPEELDKLLEQDLRNGIENMSDEDRK